MTDHVIERLAAPAVLGPAVGENICEAHPSVCAELLERQISSFEEGDHMVPGHIEELGRLAGGELAAAARSRAKGQETR